MAGTQRTGCRLPFTNLTEVDEEEEEEEEEEKEKDGIRPPSPGRISSIRATEQGFILLIDANMETGKV